MLGSRIALLSVHRATHSPARRINETVHDKRAITADVALRLSRALRLGDMFWIDMQAHYDAEIARVDSDRANRLNSRKIRGCPPLYVSCCFAMLSGSMPGAALAETKSVRSLPGSLRVHYLGQLMVTYTLPCPLAASAPSTVVT